MDVVVYIATSLDGFIATPDGGVEWLEPFQQSGTDHGYKAFYDSVDVLVMGSRTYEEVLGFGAWPYADKPCWVLSGRRLPTPHRNVFLTSETPPDVVWDLSRRGHQRAWLVGGGRLVASFRAAKRITSYEVFVCPVILGDGLPLFTGGGAPEHLRLLGSQVWPSGIVQLSYGQPEPTGR